MKPENRVKEKRVALGLAQAKLAERAGITSKQVRRIETRVCYPTAISKQKLSVALLCDVDELFPRHEPKP